MTLELQTYDVQIELLEDLLGTVPLQRAVYSNYIAAKGREMMEKQAKKGIAHSNGEAVTSETTTALLTEEEETIEEIEDRGHTGFHTDDHGPFLFDYSLKGFLCEAGRTMARAVEKEYKLKQLQDKLKRFCFITPRRIRLPVPEKIEDFAGKPMLVVTDKGIVCERPLRCLTAQGPRVTVTRSDVILAGAKINFSLRVLDGGGITAAILRDVLSYGELIGLGQWRSGGWGRFTVVSFTER